MRKRRKNLYLDPDALERGERYAELRETNVSQLVSDFLANLPLDDGEYVDLPPAVRRLLGVGVGMSGPEDYRRHLLKKYGA